MEVLNRVQVSMTASRSAQKPKKLAQAVEAVGDGLWEWEIKNGKLKLSARAADILGYNSEEQLLQPSSWRELVHPDDREILWQSLRSLLSGAEPFFSCECRMKRLNGHYEYATVRAMGIHGTKYRIKQLTGIVRDTGTTRQQEETLQKTRQQFQKAFTHSGVGMAIVTTNGKFGDVNEALCNMLGYSREELCKLDFQTITYPDDLEGDIELVEKMLRREIETYRIEKRYVSKRHKIIHAILTVSLVWNADGEPDFFISQIVDITDQKQLQKQLEDKSERIEAASENLQEKIAQLEYINRMIVHDLRGPAGNLKMLSGMLRRGDYIMPKEEMLELVEVGAEELMTSLSEMLNIVRIPSGKDVPYDDCYLPEILDVVIGRLQGPIFESNASIEFDLSVERVMYPKVYLESILYNFMSNALKYTRPDVIPCIRIGSHQEGSVISLRISDNGLGIDLDKNGHRLFKLNQVFHAGYDSKGIGLFITKAQVESLGGYIEVNSKVNEGTRFTVFL